jgi:hypothetical protein
MSRLVWIFAFAAGCGAAQTRKDAQQSLLYTSPEQMLRGSVTNGGLLFPDADCKAQFSAPGQISGDKLPAFGKCLAGLHLQASSRKSALEDVVTVTYGPGIEIEARVIEEQAGPRLTWIGYEASRETSSAPPTIGAEALENLRTAGERNGPIDIGAIDQLGLDLNLKDDVAFTWVRLCLDAEGKVTAMQAREASSLTASRVFMAAAASWKFRPFVAYGQAIPVCSYVEMVYPPQMAPKEPVIPMPSNTTGTDQVIVANANLSRQRIRGDAALAPADATRTAIERAHVRHVAGAFQICLDATGHVSSVRPLQSTGVPQYDQELMRGINGWVYSPYLDSGKPVPVCTAAAFSYSER